SHGHALHARLRARAADRRPALACVSAELPPSCGAAEDTDRRGRRTVRESTGQRAGQRASGAVRRRWRRDVSRGAFSRARHPLCARRAARTRGIRIRVGLHLALFVLADDRVPARHQGKFQRGGLLSGADSRSRPASRCHRFAPDGSHPLLILGCLGDPAPRRGSREDLASEWSEAWYHNSAAALLDGDRIVAAVEEERLTRRKETGKFPFDAIEYCLSSVGATLDDLAWIAFGEVGGPGEWRDPRISQARIADVLRSRLPSARELTTRIQLVDHHLGHAYSAYVPSSFERALVFTSDGFGDGRSGLVAIGRDGQDVTPISTISFANSLGRFYSSVLPYLGYRGGDEYKVMGLAPYGDPTVYRDVFARLYTLLPSGGYRIASHDAAAMTHRLSQMAPQRRNGSPIEQAHKDVAAAVQEAF